MFFLLCVLAKAVFGEHEGIRLPREDYVERLAEERCGELWCAAGYHHVDVGTTTTSMRQTSRKRPPLMRGSAHPSETSTSSRVSGIAVGPS